MSHFLAKVFGNSRSIYQPDDHNFNVFPTLDRTQGQDSMGAMWAEPFVFLPHPLILLLHRYFTYTVLAHGKGFGTK